LQEAFSVYRSNAIVKLDAMMLVGIIAHPATLMALREPIWKIWKIGWALASWQLCMHTLNTFNQSLSAHDCYHDDSKKI